MISRQVRLAVPLALCVCAGDTAAQESHWNSPGRVACAAVRTGPVRVDRASYCDRSAEPITTAWSRPQEARSVGRAFAVESVGGMAGSAIGLGVSFLVLDPGGCGSDDLLCVLEKVGAGLAVSALTAGAGSLYAGRVAHTQPSTWGIVIGALAGVPAGVGVVHLLSEELDWSRDDAVLFVSYAVTHGIVTAIGSRIGAALRDL